MHLFPAKSSKEARSIGQVQQKLLIDITLSRKLVPKLIKPAIESIWFNKDWAARASVAIDDYGI
jgi:hypothetical protein